MSLPEELLTVQDLIEQIESRFSGTVKKDAYAETTFFYNPGNELPNGVYFLTIKQSDGPNDSSSKLSRSQAYRVSFKPLPKTYEQFFGKKPPRPGKGKPVSMKFDPSELDVWMPHAVYAWMGWTMILSPSQKSIAQLWPHIQESYDQARTKFEKRTRR